MALNFPNSPTDGDIHTDNGIDFIYRDPPGCWTLFDPNSFIGLGDTPADYVGQAGKLVAVTGTEDALEFVEGGGGGGASITVGDTFPNPADDNALHYKTTEVVGLYVRYNDGTDEAQWVQTNGGGGGGGGLPVGALMDFAFSTPPEGWIEQDGRALLAGEYPDLRAALIADGSIWGDDGSGNPLIPNARGRFNRAAHNGAVLGEDIAVGGYQDDAYRSHEHAIPGQILFGDGPAGSAFPSTVSGNGFRGSSGTSLAGGAETRPYAMGVLACIKATN